MRKHRKKIALFGTMIVASLAIAVPFAQSHATLTLILPVPGIEALDLGDGHLVPPRPGERYGKSTWKVVMTVPDVAQSSMLIRQTPGWKTTLGLKDTGQKDGNGNPISVVTTGDLAGVARKPHRPRVVLLRRIRVPVQEPGHRGAVCFPVPSTTTVRRRAPRWRSSTGQARPGPRHPRHA